jgi:hypothetical protein
MPSEDDSWGGMLEAIVEIVKFEIELVMFQFDSFKPVETRPMIWADCELIPGLLESDTTALRIAFDSRARGEVEFGRVRNVEFHAL